MVPWTTVKMSTGFSTRKMRRGATKSSSSTVPWTTPQLSTSRSSQPAVPRTNARTLTLSAEQQRLREVVACLPGWYSYGNKYPVYLLHPRVTTLREEYQPVNHCRVNPTTTHHRLHSCPKCQQLPADRVNSPSLGLYTKNLKQAMGYMATLQALLTKPLTT